MAGLVLAAGALTGVASPAAAFENCPAGAFCEYLSNNTTGVPGTVYGDNTNLLQYNRFNNAGSVASNGTQRSVRFSSGAGYIGSSTSLARGSVINLQTTVWYRNVASNRWC